jgi:hypothetical protein
MCAIFFLLGERRWQSDWLHIGHFSVQARNANVSGYAPQIDVP